MTHPKISKVYLNPIPEKTHYFSENQWVAPFEAPARGAICASRVASEVQRVKQKTSGHSEDSDDRFCISVASGLWILCRWKWFNRKQLWKLGSWAETDPRRVATATPKAVRQWYGRACRQWHPASCVVLRNQLTHWSSQIWLRCSTGEF